MQPLVLGSVSLRVFMPGWSCLVCGLRTFRRPPDNICSGCRSCRRGRLNLKVTKRFKAKGRPISLSERERGVGASQGQSQGHKQTLSSGSSATVKEDQGQQQPGEGHRQSAPSAAISGESRRKASPALQDSDAHPMSTLRHVLSNLWLPVLLELFGFARAHIILGQAGMLLEKMEGQGQKTCFAASALLSYATALTGLHDADEIRVTMAKTLRTRDGLTMEKFREAECLWLMATPSSSADTLPEQLRASSVS